MGFDTKVSINESLFFVSLGILGLAMTILGGPSVIAASGIMYGPVCMIYFSITGSIFGKKRKQLLTKMEIPGENVPI
jgi:hypothetical protein